MASLGLRLVTPVPTGASGVLLSVVAIQPSNVGNLRVYGDSRGPVTLSPPAASSVNYVVGRDAPNLVMVPLPVGGVFDLYDDQPAGGHVDLAIDVVGYIVGSSN